MEKAYHQLKENKAVKEDYHHLLLLTTMEKAYHQLKENKAVKMNLRIA
jgi:DNA-binding transcriptional regulator YhcF (GntR family)